jgi:hypothetical protein
LFTPDWFEVAFALIVIVWPLTPDIVVTVADPPLIYAAEMVIPGTILVFVASVVNILLPLVKVAA